MTHYPDPGPAGMALERALQAVRQAVSCQPGTPEQLIEERVARLEDQMIGLSVLALDPEQMPLVEREWRGIAQILLRAQLMLSVFKGQDVEAIRRLICALDACNKPSGLRIVQNARAPAPAHS